MMRSEASKSDKLSCWTTTGEKNENSAGPGAMVAKLKESQFNELLTVSFSRLLT